MNRTFVVLATDVFEDAVLDALCALQQIRLLLVPVLPVGQCRRYLDPLQVALALADLDSWHRWNNVLLGRRKRLACVVLLSDIDLTAAHLSLVEQRAFFRLPLVADFVLREAGLHRHHLTVTSQIQLRVIQTAAVDALRAASFHLECLLIDAIGND